ncbi:hypothetical protein Tco_1436370, partial [Tanacetum coccineum]
IHQVLDCSPTNRKRELGLDRRETGIAAKLPSAGLWLNASKSESMPERGDFHLHQSDTNRPLAQNLTRPALAVPWKLGLFAGVLQLYSAQD